MTNATNTAATLTASDIAMLKRFRGASSAAPVMLRDLDQALALYDRGLLTCSVDVNFWKGVNNVKVCDALFISDAGKKALADALAAARD